MSRVRAFRDDGRRSSCMSLGSACGRGALSQGRAPAPLLRAGASCAPASGAGLRLERFSGDRAQACVSGVAQASPTGQVAPSARACSRGERPGWAVASPLPGRALHLHVVCAGDSWATSSWPSGLALCNYADLGIELVTGTLALSWCAWQSCERLYDHRVSELCHIIEFAL